MWFFSFLRRHSHLIVAHISQVETHEQETVEDANKGIIEPDEGNLSLLMSMGIPEHHARRALVGTKNGSLDAVFEYIEHHENDPEFNKPLPNSSENEENGKKKRKKPRFIPIELQRLFTQLQLIDQQAVSTNGEISNIYLLENAFQHFALFCHSKHQTMMIYFNVFCAYSLQN